MLAGCTARGRAAGTRPRLAPGTGKKARRARAPPGGRRRRGSPQAAEAGNRKKALQGNVTDPDSRLPPVRGGGFTQGYNCQDAAADDRLHARRLRLPGPRRRAAGAAARAGGRERRRGRRGRPRRPRRMTAMVAECHAALCTLPEKDRHDPGHDPAACHAAMTGGIGVFVADAGYHSQVNLEAPRPGPAHRRRQDPRPGPPRARRRTPARRRHRRGGQRAPAAHPPGPRPLQAPRPRRRGTARQPQRPRRPAPPQPPRPAQRHQRVPVRFYPRAQLPGCWPPSAEPRWPSPPRPRSARPGRSIPANTSRTPQQQHNGHSIPPAKHAPGPNPETGTARAQPPQETATAPGVLVTIHT